MRASTIKHINERIDHAKKTHGEFASADHIIAAAGIELMEATVAAHYAGDIVHELLDGAVVLIRGAEQLGGIEGCFYDPADVAFKPAVEPTDEQVEALAKVLHEADQSHSKTYYTWESRAESIRDDYMVTARAAYAHIGAEVAKLRAHLAPWLQPRTVTEEQIEKAARGLYENYVIWSWGRAGDWIKESGASRNLWKDRAIAAFEAAGFIAEGQSDAAV